MNRMAVAIIVVACGTGCASAVSAETLAYPRHTHFCFAQDGNPRYAQYWFGPGGKAIYRDAHEQTSDYTPKWTGSVTVTGDQMKITPTSGPLAGLYFNFTNRADGIWKDGRYLYYPC